MLLIAESVRIRNWYRSSPDDDSRLVLGEGVAGPVDIAPSSEPVSTVGKINDTVSKITDSVNLVFRQGDMFFADGRRRSVTRHGVAGRPEPVYVINNPAHIRSVMTASTDDAVSATSTSPVRPIVGPNSVLTAIGDRHRQQRALLMPEFHGKAVARYQKSIEEAVARHIDALRPGELFRMADLGQAITLDVIMTAIFGIDHRDSTPAELRLRKVVVAFLHRSTSTVAPFAQMVNMNSEDPVGPLKLVLIPVDAAVYAVINERRRNRTTGNDILSVLMAATTESGQPLSDKEIRDELLTLLLAGHETTSNTLAWTFERLTRYPDQYHRAKSADEELLEAILNESMRARPVAPIVARRMLRPWRFDDQIVERKGVALVSILLLHHRDDLYPKPFEFNPDRFLGKRMPPHTFIPFGGGNRRCLGSMLAMAELRTVTRAILERVDLRTHTRPGEVARHRNVTMIPADGGLVKAEKIR